MISYKQFNNVWVFIGSKIYTTETCQRFDGIRGHNKANWYIVGKHNALVDDIKSVNKKTRADII